MVRAWGGHKNIVPCSTSSCYAHGCIYFRKRYGCAGGIRTLLFSLVSEELKDYLLGDGAVNKIFTLGNSEFPVSWENEIKMWTFLETRAALLLKTYKTTSQVSGLVESCHRRGVKGSSMVQTKWIVRRLKAAIPLNGH